jgi:hypothetical protein
MPPSVLGHPTLDKILSQIDSLSKLSAEKGRAFDLRKLYVGECTTRRESYLAGLDKQLHEAQDLLRQAAEAATAGQDGKVIDLARRSRIEAAKIAFDGNATDAQKGEAKKIQDDAARLADTVVGVANLLRSVRTAYNRPDDLVKALQQFATAYPTHELTPEFERAIGASGVWGAIVDWENRAAGWYLNPLPENKRTIETRLQAIDEHLRLFPSSPYKIAAENARELMAPALDVLDPDEGGLLGLNDMTEMLNHVLITGLYQVQRRSGERYYLVNPRLETVKKPDGTVVYYQFKHIVDGKLTEKRTSVKADEVTLKGETAPPAAQAAFAAAARELLRGRHDKNWRTVYLQVAELGRTNRDIDPCLNATILKTVLTKAIDCCRGKAIEPQSRQIQAVLKSISGEDWEKYLWMNPDDEDAEKVRNLAATILGNCPRLEPIITSIRVAVDTQRNVLGRTLVSYRPVGILLRLPGEVEFQGTLTQGELYVITSSPAGLPQFVRIGEVTDTGRKLDAEVIRRCARGCPVFLKPRKKSP